ncbi:MAG: TonB-dependent receptor, partial [Steroidobacteraceae bacterium]
NTSIAAASATLSGRVLDQASGLPLPQAAVSVQLANADTIATATVVANDGRFILTGLEPGEYLVNVTAIGYAAQGSPLFVGDKNDIYYVGDVRLTADEILEEVLVVGQTSTVATLSNREYSLADNFAQATGSLLDAMKGLPGITIDQEGKVLLRGSDKVTILIDGKPSGLTGYGNQKGLDSISAANAASIQIINNPSARYDAAGMAGIINIIYKKENKLGLNGDVGLSFGIGQLTRSKDDLPTDVGSYTSNRKISPTLNLNYANDSSRSYFQAEYLAQNDLPNNEFATRYYSDGRVILSQVPENRVQTQYTLKAGTDWTLPSGDLLTLSGIYDFETHTDRSQVPFIDAATMTRNRFWFWREEEDTGFANFAVNYKWPFANPGHEMDLRVEYTRGWEDEAYYLNEVSSVRTGTDATHIVAKEHTLPVTLDYVQPLRSGRLEAGIKYQARWIPVTYDVTPGNQTVIYPGLGDWSDWDENIYSGYANYLHETSNFDVEVGLRLENTEVKYRIPTENIYYPSSDAYDYFELFPNVKFTWRLNDESNVLAAYNRRVDRPGEPQLRIFPKYDDPELLKVGNPYLRPQFTDVFELGYERFWESGSASISAYLRNIKDPFLRVYAIDDTNPNYDIVNKIFQNVGNSRQQGIELLATQDVNHDWRISGSFNWYQNKIEAFQTRLFFPTVRPFAIAESNDSTWDFKLSNQIKLPWSLQLQLSYLYYADRNIPQGIEYSRSSLDFGLKRPVWKDGEIILTVSDLFSDFGLRQKQVSSGVTTLYENLYETQTVSLGMKYRF